MAAAPLPSPIDPDQAAAILAEFRVTEDLALRFPADGCYARAHAMMQRLAQRGIAPEKIWAFAVGAGDILWAETSDYPEGRVRWTYRVAVLLTVHGPDVDSTREVVLDPLLFDRVASVAEWVAAVHDTPTLVRTLRGEPPLPERGGSGYWPGPDPLEGPDTHARETLEEYGRHGLE